MGISAFIGPALGLVGSLFGSKKQARSQETQNYQNLAMQKEFAQQGIRWKVEDAKRAGLHPLAALGANTMSYSPQRVGTTPSPDFRGFGQDISRAIQTQKTAGERELIALQILDAKETVKHKELINQGLQKKLSELDATPPMPSTPHDPESGVLRSSPTDYVGIQGNRGVKWKDRDLEKSDRPGIAAGMAPGEQFVRMGEKTAMRTISKELSEPMESSWFSNFQYFGYRLAEHVKRFVRAYGSDASVRQFVKYLRKQQPNRSAGKGREWRYNHWTGLWKSRKIGKRSKVLDSKFIPY